MELKTVYFDEPGTENTEAALNIAKQRAEALGIKTILVASTNGDTAVKAMDILQGFRVIVVTHITGFKEPNAQEFTAANRKTVEGKGGIILTTTHALSGISRAMRVNYNMFMEGEVIADTLRIFGQGTKVACEIALMAVDNDLVKSGEDVIAVAGSSSGADTALLLRAVNTHNFFSLKVREVLCKPHF